MFFWTAIAIGLGLLVAVTIVLMIFIPWLIPLVVGAAIVGTFSKVGWP